jgi:hypothetical protein
MTKNLPFSSSRVTTHGTALPPLTSKANSSVGGTAAAFTTYRQNIRITEQEMFEDLRKRIRQLEAELNEVQ